MCGWFQVNQPDGFKCLTSPAKIQMLPDQQFQTLPADARAGLARLSTALEGQVPDEIRTWKFSTSDFPDTGEIPQIVRNVHDWAGGKGSFLYYLMVSQPANLQEIRSCFLRAKTEQQTGKKRAYARAIHIVSNCIYVGGSQTVSERLKQHLGYANAGTYALHLYHWAVPLALNLELVCARYPSETPKEALQALEDSLWERLQPMFGRKGNR